MNSPDFTFLKIDKILLITISHHFDIVTIKSHYHDNFVLMILIELSYLSLDA